MKLSLLFLLVSFLFVLLSSQFPQTSFLLLIFLLLVIILSPAFLSSSSPPCHTFHLPFRFLLSYFLPTPSPALPLYTTTSYLRCSLLQPHHITIHAVVFFLHLLFFKTKRILAYSLFYSPSSIALLSQLLIYHLEY